MTTLMIRLGVFALAMCAALVTLAVFAGHGRESNVLAYRGYFGDAAQLFLADIGSGFTFQLSRFGDTDFDWSADGQSLVLADAHADIYTVGFEPYDVHQLTPQVEDNVMPTWSPDGRQIAFASSLDGHVAVYLMDADGSNQHELVDLSTSIPSLALSMVRRLRWSPAGRWISLEIADYATIYVIDTATSHVRRLSSDGTAVEWSPDGLWITYQERHSGYHDIYTLNIETGEKHRLTNTDHDDLNPIWSPHGREIAYIGQGEPYEGMTVDQICIVDADGSNLRVLPLMPLIDISDLDWSPDGTRLVFSGRDLIHYSIYSSFNIYVIDNDGRNLRRIIEGPAAGSAGYYSYSSLAWKP